MGDPVVEFEFEKYVAALVASSTQALPSQLGISTGEDVARLRRDPSIQAALKKCDDTVDRLRRMQVHLEQAAAEINRQAAAIRSDLEPVMSLPPEILSEIFKLVVHTPPCIDEEPDRVLRIAAVCRKWRYTALATRNLWALFNTSRSQAQQAAWLARSSPGPIDVLVKGRDWVAAPLRLELCHEAFRWRSIMLLDVKSTVDYLDTLMKLPNLRNLQTINFALPGWYYPTDEVERDARDFQSTLPRLKSISIGYIAISNMSTIAENLTNLSLSNVAYPSVEWWKLLRSCQNLDILKLDNNEVLSSGSDRPDSALENIVLPRLQDLTLGTDLDGLGDMIFDHVSAPALHSLDVCHYCRVDPSEPCLCMSLRPFLKRHHTIVTLKIDDFFWAQDAINWLSTSPDVTIDGTLAPGYNQPLPNLKHLKLYSSDDPWPSSLVMGILSAREHLIMSRGLGASPKVFTSLTTRNIKYSEEWEDWIDKRVENFTWDDFFEDSDEE